VNVFLDSSALAKRYVNEAGSDRVDEILSAASSVALSVICYPEVVSGMCRLRREGRLSSRQYLESKRALIGDVADSVLIPITDQVFS